MALLPQECAIFFDWASLHQKMSEGSLDAAQVALDLPTELPTEPWPSSPGPTSSPTD